MFWRKKKFTDKAIVYLKSSRPVDRLQSLEVPLHEFPVFQHFSDELCVFYLIDRGSSYEYVKQCDMERDGIDRDELHRIGLRNLRALVTQRQARVQPYQGVFAFFMHGDFEASVILLDDLWDGEFRQFVPGEYAAAIPARDILAFCNSSSAEGLAELERIVERSQPAGDHLLTRKILIRRGTTWMARAA